MHDEDEYRWSEDEAISCLVVDFDVCLYLEVIVVCAPICCVYLTLETWILGPYMKNLPYESRARRHLQQTPRPSIRGITLGTVIPIVGACPDCRLLTIRPNSPRRVAMEYLPHQA